jgi:hypothetical protein
VLFGLYPAPLLDGLHYNAYNLIFNYDSSAKLEEYYLGEKMLNWLFDLFDFKTGQVNYIDLDEPSYTKLAKHLDKYYKISK